MRDLTEEDKISVEMRKEIRDTFVGAKDHFKDGLDHLERVFDIYLDYIGNINEKLHEYDKLISSLRGRVEILEGPKKKAVPMGWIILYWVRGYKNLVQVLLDKLAAVNTDTGEKPPLWFSSKEMAEEYAKDYLADDWEVIEV